MGGTASTRKITLVNDEESGVIKISDSVVMRLRGEIEQSAKSKPKADNKSVPPPPAPPTRESQPRAGVQQPHLSSKPSKQSGFTTYDHDLRNQASRYSQERDEEIRKLEADWFAKLNAAEEQNNIVQNKMAEKFTSAVDEVGKLFPKRLCEPVCMDVQHKVQRCYETNQKTSLNCSKEVREFSECVQQARLVV